MKTFPQIAEVKPLDGKKLLVRFQTGEKKIYDCSPLLLNPAFSSLINEDFFMKVKCDQGGYGICWNDEIDISESELWLHGEPFQETVLTKRTKSDLSLKENKRKEAQGFRGTQPRIKKIEFTQRGAFSLFMQDGRIITVPLKAFPSIKKLTATQRQSWYILDDVGFSFDDCAEVFHIEQVLGDFSQYKYSFLPQTQNKHCAEDSVPFVPSKKAKRKS